MNIKHPQSTFSALALAVVVGLSGPAQAQSAAGSSPGAAAPSAASKAAQPQVDDKAAREAGHDSLLRVQVLRFRRCGLLPVSMTPC
jgi:hypothetical protein